MDSQQPVSIPQLDAVAKIICAGNVCAGGGKGMDRLEMISGQSQRPLGRTALSAPRVSLESQVSGGVDLHVRSFCSFWLQTHWQGGAAGYIQERERERESTVLK